MSDEFAFDANGNPVDAADDVADDYEPVPEDEEVEFADGEDFFVTRDEEGELQTTMVESEHLDRPVEVRPMVYGEAERYFGSAGGVSQIDSGVIANVLRNHVVTPDLDAIAAAREEWPEDEFSARHVEEEMFPLVPAGLIMAVMKASGFSDIGVDMDDEGSATVTYEQPGN